MAGPRYRNIFLSTSPRSFSYTNPQRGGSGPRLPDFRDRQEHSRFLKSRFEEAWKAASEKTTAVSVLDRNGVYIEFAGEPGFDLMIESLEYARSGIRLLNVRKKDSENHTVTMATVYIPRNKRSHFLKRIEKYAEEETKTGTPKNKPLIESISQIQEATLSSFWQKDEFLMIPEKDPLWTEVWLRGETEELYSRFVSTVQDMGIELAD